MLVPGGSPVRLFWSRASGAVALPARQHVKGCGDVQSQRQLPEGPELQEGSAMLNWAEVAHEVPETKQNNAKHRDTHVPVQQRCESQKTCLPSLTSPWAQSLPKVEPKPKSMACHTVFVALLEKPASLVPKPGPAGPFSTMVRCPVSSRSQAKPSVCFCVNSAHRRCL